MLEKPKTDAESIYHRMIYRFLRRDPAGPHRTAKEVMRVTAEMLSELHTRADAALAEDGADAPDHPPEQVQRIQESFGAFQDTFKASLDADADAVRNDRNYQAVADELTEMRKAFAGKVRENDRLELQNKRLKEHLDQLGPQVGDAQKRADEFFADRESAERNVRRLQTELDGLREVSGQAEARNKDTIRRLKSELRTAELHGKQHGGAIQRALEENKRLCGSLQTAQASLDRARELLAKEQRAADKATKAAVWREQWAEGFCGELDAMLINDAGEPSVNQGLQVQEHRRRLAEAAEEKGAYWRGCQAAVAFVEKLGLEKGPLKDQRVQMKQLRRAFMDLVDSDAPEFTVTRAEDGGAVLSAALLVPGKLGESPRQHQIQIQPARAGSRFSIERKRYLGGDALDAIRGAGAEVQVTWDGEPVARSTDEELGQLRQFIDEMVSNDSRITLYRHPESNELLEVRLDFQREDGSPVTRAATIRPDGDDASWKPERFHVSLVGRDRLAELEAGQAVAEDLTAKKVAQFLEQHPSDLRCAVNECELCAWRDCPHNDVMHTHHDGCPSCSNDPMTETTFAVNQGAQMTMTFLARYMASSETRFRWGARGDLKGLLEEMLEAASEYWRRIRIVSVTETSLETVEVKEEEMPF